MADVKVVAPVPAPVVAPVVVAPEVVAEQAAHAEGLVPMVKEGHVSFVHHMTVAAHEAVGKVVAPVPAPVVAPVVVAPEVVAEQAAHAEGLVPMVKEGHVSFVHHMTVAAHEAVGWVKSAFKHI